MTQAEFDALVGRLETFAARRPGTYKLRVAGLAALGYLYIVGVLLMLMLLFGLLMVLLATGKMTLLAIKLGLPLLFVLGAIFRAIWVRIGAPTGLAITRRDAPALFEALDDMRRRLKGPRIHRVLLTDEYNAAVMQVPRLGLLGWQKNFLIIGLPAMHALSVDQFRAVLAHEYGHLAGAHSRFSAWIYRVRRTWQQLLQALHRKQGWGVGLFNRFFDWYAPFFSAYTFVLARANEYQADRSAAELVGARTAADALVNFSIQGAYLDQRYWPRLYERAAHEPAPAFAPYSELPNSLRDAVRPDDAERWLSDAMARATGTDDTHPALQDRLRALRQEARVPSPVDPTAAQHFLGASLGVFSEKLDQHWQARVAQSWRERYDYVQDGKQKLAALDSKAQSAELNVQESWDQARWTEEFLGAGAALPLYQAVRERAPEEAAPLLAIGRLLLADNDARGRDLLEQAMARDAGLTEAACEHVYHYLHRQGQSDEAAKYFQRAQEYRQKMVLANTERAQLNISDPLLPHSLGDTAIEALRAQLRDHPRIRRAYLACKQVEHFSEQPVYVLGIEYGNWMSSQRSAANLIQLLIREMKFPGETFVLLINHTNNSAQKKIGKRLKAITGAQIYPR